ncbi:MAG TPA: alpha/beta fold hydrolase [Anaerolineaceae bacterium]|nr:alpha/beta fold hydrolase [Anaerolineaceae bacterium]
MKLFRITSLMLTLIIFTSCIGMAASSTGNNQLIQTAVQPTEPEIATLTPSPLAEVTSPTPTITPMPTPAGWSTEAHPLQIEMERTWSYPGSEITFEETLPSKATYDQYIVSYLSDGYKIYAYMAIPNGIKPDTGWPSIVLNHGYHNPATYSTTENYIAFMDVLSRSGYIVLKPDYRAHGKSEGPRPVGGGYGSPDYMVDVLNAVASLKAYEDADPERIGMVGHSMGGAITLRAMVVSKDIKAGVIWSGVVASYSTLVYRWNRNVTPTATALAPNSPPNTPTVTVPSFRGGVSSWANDLFGMYGSPEQNPAFWDSISPTAHLTELSGPLQLQAAKGDTQVPYIWSEELGANLEAASMPYELFIYEKDNHNITDNFLIAIQRTMTFFNKYVKNR